MAQFDVHSAFTVILSREDGEGSQVTQAFRISRSFAVFAAQDDDSMSNPHASYRNYELAP
jgi:hypothetical protein